MAISPNVNLNSQRLTQNRENITPEQTTFNRLFSDKAYQVLTSKFPKLLNQIITFKIIDSFPEKGSCVGTFILRAGEDVRYIPVLMSNGDIESAEMVYDKNGNTFMPLSNAVVTDIINANMLRPESLIKDPRIEDTSNLMREMYRPPTASNLVTASNVSVESLPNEYKKALSDYFISNPVLLAKVASFYPIDVLASKLAQKKVPDFDQPLPPESSVIKLANMTSEAAKKLSADQKQEILQRGYLICKEAEDAIDAIPSLNLKSDMESELKLIEKPNTAHMHGCGYIFRLHNNEIQKVKCLVAWNTVFTHDGILDWSSSESIVMSDFTDGICEADLIEFGAEPVTTFKPSIKQKDSPEPGTVSASGDSEQDGYCPEVYLFYPKRSGQYKIFTEISEDDRSINKELKAERFYISDFMIQKVDDTIYFKNKYGLIDTIGFMNQVTVGYVKISDGEYVLPKTSYAIHPKKDIRTFVKTIGSLHRLLRNTGVLIRFSDNGAGYTVSDNTGTKTASFHKIADAIEYLIDECRLTKKAVENLIKDKQILVLEKNAFLSQSQEEQPQIGESVTPGIYQDVQQPQQDPNIEVDEETLSEFAGVDDEDLMDTGMLASLSSNEDIKVLLVDMLPEFTETCSNLGQTILNFIANNEEISDFYGEDEYQSILGKMRKIFKMLGELVSDLQKYVNM